MQNISDFSAVIWDMDGVIVDSETIWQVEEPKFIVENFPKFSFEDCKQFMGQSPKGVFDILKTRHKELEWEDFFEAQKNLALEKVYPFSKIFPGVVSILQILQKTHLQAVASSALAVWIDHVIETNNLEEYFEHIVSAEEVGGISKPEPDVFLHTAKKLKMQPEKCLVIEDSPNGILAGKRAGMTVWAFKTPSNEGRDISLADKVFTDFSEIF